MKLHLLLLAVALLAIQQGCSLHHQASVSTDIQDPDMSDDVMEPRKVKPEISHAVTGFWRDRSHLQSLRGSQYLRKMRSMCRRYSFAWPLCHRRRNGCCCRWSRICILRRCMPRCARRSHGCCTSSSTDKKPESTILRRPVIKKVKLEISHSWSTGSRELDMRFLRDKGHLRTLHGSRYLRKLQSMCRRYRFARRLCRRRADGCCCRYSRICVISHCRQTCARRSHSCCKSTIPRRQTVKPPRVSEQADWLWNLQRAERARHRLRLLQMRLRLRNLQLQRRLRLQARLRHLRRLRLQQRLRNLRLRQVRLRERLRLHRLRLRQRLLNPLIDPVIFDETSNAAEETSPSDIN